MVQPVSTRFSAVLHNPLPLRAIFTFVPSTKGGEKKRGRVLFRARERKRNIIGTRRTCDTRKIYDVSSFFIYIFFFVPFLFFSFSLFFQFIRSWNGNSQSRVRFFFDIQSLDKLKVCASIYIYIYAEEGNIVLWNSNYFLISNFRGKFNISGMSDTPRVRNKSRTVIINYSLADVLTWITTDVEFDIRRQLNTIFSIINKIPPPLPQF